MSSILNNNWYNLNSTRKYPLDDGCTGIDDVGKLFPATLITDLHLRLNKSVGVGAMISSIVVSNTLVSVTFLAINHPILPSLYDPAPPAPSFSPLCAVSLRKPVEPGVVYPIEPLTSGVAGWIVFGDGIARTFNGRFSTAAQSSLATKVCRYYNDFPVTSIGKLNSAYTLKGLVNLVEGADIAITKETRTINSEAKEAIVFTLKENTASNVYQTYGGPCAGRPESNTCSKEGIQFINTVAPDCNGNIELVFDSPFRVAGLVTDLNPGLSSSSSSDGYIETKGGIVVDYPIGLTDACTRGDRLPDAQGNLPGQYLDQCAEDPTDPDANADPGDPVGPPAVAISSSTLDCVELPVYLNFDEGSSRFWQVVKGSFEFSPTDSPYEPLTSYSSSSMTYYSSSMVSSSSYTYFDPIERSYFASGLNGRNISLWYNCGYSSLIGTRIQIDLLLENTEQYYPNGGLILNYRPNADSTLDEYFIVELNKRESSLKISRFNGFAPVLIASAKGIGIGENIWYRLVAEVTESATPGRTRITGKVYNASTMSLLGTAIAESSLYLPDTGKVGLTSDKSTANFSYFRMENI